MVASIIVNIVKIWVGSGEKRNDRVSNYLAGRQIFSQN